MEEKAEDIIKEPESKTYLNNVNETKSILDTEDLTQPTESITEIEEEDYVNLPLDTNSTTGYSRPEPGISNLFNLSEGTTITPWKLIKDFPTRVLEFNDETVVVECLVDKENKLYEEREFPSYFFDQIQLLEGLLVKLCYYKRATQVMMEIKHSEGLVLESDFPESNFANRFKHLTLKKHTPSK